MTRGIFSSICIVALVVLIAGLGLVMGVLYDYFNQVEHQQLRNQLELAAHAIERQGADYFNGLHLTDCRITWVDTQGHVLYDTDADETQMPSHLQREEIEEALQTGYGESVRYSDTMMERSLYVAQRLTDGTVVRLSIFQSTVLILVMGMVQPVCVVLLVVLILALILASRLARRIVRPLNELDLDQPLGNKGYPELSPLLHRIHSQKKQIQQQKQELNRQKEEFQTVIAGMEDGLVLMNRQGTILSINPAAGRLLGADQGSVGLDIFAVNQSLEIRQLVAQAIQAQRCETTVHLSTGDYLVDASPVLTDGVVTGVVLLLLDVTEKLSAETMRREFTANVSHELKTPLHSISGYAELLSHGLVQPSDVPGFSQKIYTETQRMIRLVEDILHLSYLDEGAVDTTWEPVDLEQLFLEIQGKFAQAARDSQVTLEIQASGCSLVGVRQLLSTMISNLCDNAIKYNRPGGQVSLSARQTDGGLVLAVRDTGIGIPREHQGRIFERFYRVDKSHSKEVGGTGLGLSIVKHAAAVHKAKIDLESMPGKGTTITVQFPL